MVSYLYIMSVTCMALMCVNIHCPPKSSYTFQFYTTDFTDLNKNYIIPHALSSTCKAP